MFLKHDKQTTELARVRTENQALRAELRHQWEDNHFEHCGKPWPHQGRCYWPLPEVLGGSDGGGHRRGPSEDERRLLAEEARRFEHDFRELAKE